MVTCWLLIDYQRMHGTWDIANLWTFKDQTQSQQLGCWFVDFFINIIKMIQVFSREHMVYRYTDSYFC